jgi:hypothetical protein
MTAFNLGARALGCTGYEDCVGVSEGGGDFLSEDLALGRLTSALLKLKPSTMPDQPLQAGDPAQATAPEPQNQSTVQ